MPSEEQRSFVPMNSNQRLHGGDRVDFPERFGQFNHDEDHRSLVERTDRFGGGEGTELQVRQAARDRAVTERRKFRRAYDALRVPGE